MTIDPRLQRIAASHPYPLLFATLSGAHLYGFPSPDSDYDLRGAHILPSRDVLGLGTPRETVEIMEQREGVELDLVTHDIRKFFHLLLKENGYVLEQLLSPLVVVWTPEAEELKEIARSCITRRHSAHYLGFAHNQWKLLMKKPRVKQVLYLYRVLLTGIHLMRTGRLEPNLLRLNEKFELPTIPDLIARKTAGPEKTQLDPAEIARHEIEYHRLETELEEAGRLSTLPEEPSPETHAALDDLLVRIRLK